MHFRVQARFKLIYTLVGVVGAVGSFKLIVEARMQSDIWKLCD